jgi:hypothetical protein
MKGVVHVSGFFSEPCERGERILRPRFRGALHSGHVPEPHHVWQVLRVLLSLQAFCSVEIVRPSFQEHAW